MPPENADFTQFGFFLLFAFYRLHLSSVRIWEAKRKLRKYSSCYTFNLILYQWISRVGEYTPNTIYLLNSKLLHDFLRLELYFICDSSSLRFLRLYALQVAFSVVYQARFIFFFRMCWFVLSIRLLHSWLDTWGLQLAINIYGTKKNIIISVFDYIQEIVLPLISPLPSNNCKKTVLMIPKKVKYEGKRRDHKVS